MDEIYFDDPRNARWFPTPTRPQAGAMPVRPPIYRPPFAMTAPTYAQPVMVQQPQPVAMMAPPAATPSKLRTRLGDLTIGDVLPLLAQLVVAFRPMPIAPTDTRDTDANLVNLTKFVGANAAHFHGDAQLNAAGAVLGKLLG